MHFYAADVYQGANVGVTAFLAFTPKAAGAVSLIYLVETIGWPLRETSPVLMWMLWIMAAATMTIGNTLGLLQNNVKRVLAYSSVAHSGYILVGLLVGVSAPAAQAMDNGVAAILFYLVAYGVATIGAFAVLGSIQSRWEEAETFDDLHGLAHRHPLLSGIMLVCVLSLVGMPPMVGFLGKLYLFGPAVSEGFIVLVLIGLINSAISSVYYLKIFGACFFGDDYGHFTLMPAHSRRYAAFTAALLTAGLGVFGGTLVEAARTAVEHRRRHPIEATAPAAHPNTSSRARPAADAAPSTQHSVNEDA